MYGLKQAAILAYDQLVKHLEKFGYKSIPHSLSLWTHRTRQTKFCLCVDDFDIKYYSKEDVEHLLQALKTLYQVIVDWTGKNYCGLSLDWNYDKGYVDMSMSKYLTDLLKFFYINTKNNNIPHTHGPCQNMARNNNIQKMIDLNSSYLTRTSNLYKNCGFYFILCSSY